MASFFPDTVYISKLHKPTWTWTLVGCYWQFAIDEFQKQLVKFRNDLLAVGFDGTNCTAKDYPGQPRTIREVPDISGHSPDHFSSQQPFLPPSVSDLFTSHRSFHSFIYSFNFLTKEIYNHSTINYRSIILLFGAVSFIYILQIPTSSYPAR